MSYYYFVLYKMEHMTHAVYRLTIGERAIEERNLHSTATHLWSNNTMADCFCYHIKYTNINQLTHHQNSIYKCKRISNIPVFHLNTFKLVAIKLWILPTHKLILITLWSNFARMRCMLLNATFIWETFSASIHFGSPILGNFFFFHHFDKSNHWNIYLFVYFECLWFNVRLLMLMPSFIFINKQNIQYLCIINSIKFNCFGFWVIRFIYPLFKSIVVWAWVFVVLSVKR